MSGWKYMIYPDEEDSKDQCIQQEIAYQLKRIADKIGGIK